MTHDPSIWKELWDNTVGGAAVVALLLGVWISARAVGLLNRPKHWLRSTYIPPRGLVGFFAMPHFMLEYENRGNMPVVFSDFMLMLPRIDGVVGGNGKFVLHRVRRFSLTNDRPPASAVINCIAGSTTAPTRCAWNPARCTPTTSTSERSSTT
jgi:hypothetical protein